MGLTKDQILNADDVHVKKLSIPKWGGDVYIKMLSAKERDCWESLCLKVGQCLKNGDFNDYANLSVKATLAFYSLCDEHGNRLFNDPSDIEKLNDKSGAVLDYISDEAQAFSQISDEDIEEIEKN